MTSRLHPLRLRSRRLSPADLFPLRQPGASERKTVRAPRSSPETGPKKPSFFSRSRWIHTRSADRSAALAQPAACTQPALPPPSPPFQVSISAPRLSFPWRHSAPVGAISSACQCFTRPPFLESAKPARSTQTSSASTRCYPR